MAVGRVGWAAPSWWGAGSPGSVVVGASDVEMTTGGSSRAVLPGWWFPGRRGVGEGVWLSAPSPAWRPGIPFLGGCLPPLSCQRRSRGWWWSAARIMVVAAWRAA